DAALGNGGLGRLAACFMDSLATLGLPSVGYGIRYDYGMFAQRIHEGQQIEQPDDWLANGNPWEFRRPDREYPVHFGGWVRHEGGRAYWTDTEQVRAMAYDTIIPGSGTRAVSTLRLWHAHASEALDLKMFNAGDYMRAVEQKNLSENVTRVLYPDDSSYHGRELRLRQEYFFVSASIQDMLRRYLVNHSDFEQLSDQIAIHLNDTHPAIAVPELMRLLVDIHQLEWLDAWSLCTRTFSYTNHTIMPEALETWPVPMMRSVLPRHLEIIFEINKRFLDAVIVQFPDDTDLLQKVSLIDEHGERRVRMAGLSVVASHKVNGVSALHSELIQQTLFADFVRIFPNKFCNKTNGITPRRWLAHANPGLSELIDEQIGDGWRTDLDQLQKLKPVAENSEFVGRLARVKRENKVRLAQYVSRVLGIELNPDSMFDVQIKRMHEYKRQLLNVLHIVARYQAILADPTGAWVPRTFVFAGKAASAYQMAKLIIRLINDVAQTINNDARVNQLIKVVFIPNYSVSLAELIIPAADLSEQISTAGTEASGTGNMKLALNGALTIGTLDGANVEIRDQVGADNIFIFGLKTPEVAALRDCGYQPANYIATNPSLQRVLHAIESGLFSPDEPHRYQSIVDSLVRDGDTYLLLADFATYVECQLQVDAAFRQPEHWHQMALRNIAGMGVFSSDRTIREYAREIWHVEPLVP
ncbi:MAG: glycogen/starch/alpha-glucan phosphorylase, partial [Burkholderiaceae bacterium]